MLSSIDKNVKYSNCLFFPTLFGRWIDRSTQCFKIWRLLKICLVSNLSELSEFYHYEFVNSSHKKVYPWNLYISRKTSNNPCILGSKPHSYLFRLRNHNLKKEITYFTDLLSHLGRDSTYLLLSDGDSRWRRSPAKFGRILSLGGRFFCRRR
jgi:hypothetical protein